MLIRADAGAPQVITQRGRDHVLMSGEAYRKLAGEVPNFMDLLVRQGPRFEDDFAPMHREQRPLRDPEL